MFVLMVGMLGVAALLPVGRYTIAETIKADRSATLGRAALGDAKIRGLLDPRRWTYPDVTSSGSDPKIFRAAYTGDWRSVNLGEAKSTFDPTIPPTYNIAGAFLIDPLFLAQFSTRPPRTTVSGSCHPLRFPYWLDAQPFPPKTIPRVSITAVPYEAGREAGDLAEWARTSPVYAIDKFGRFPVFWDVETAERMMRCGDDLMFYMPPDATARPQQYYPQATGSVALGTAPSLLRAAQGTYSWMLSVSPVVDFQFNQRFGASRLYNVSVVVFQDRKLDMPDSATIKPTERYVDLVVSGSRNDLSGFGWGGGDVRLVFDSRLPFEYAEIKPGEWIAIMAHYRMKPNPRMTALPGGATDYVSFPVCKWYRVIQVSPVLNQPNQRMVTLAGPDWPKINDPMANASPSAQARNPYDPQTIRAVLVSDVVGVYTEAIQLDQVPQWR